MGIEGNEVSDIWAKAAAENDTDVNNRGYPKEARLSHLTRATTEAKATGDQQPCLPAKELQPPNRYRLRGELREWKMLWVFQRPSSISFGRHALR